MERNTNTGDANVAFWFLQSNVACSTSGGAVDFSGAHADGDLLVVSEFSGGGTVSTINAYEWVGDDATGHLNTTPIASGVDCRSNLTPAEDEVCAAANTAEITTPWLTAAFKANPKVGHTLPTAQFFEGGVNLTDAGLGGTCFNTFIGDTRSSTSLTATLFDFARGQLGGCESDITSAQTWESERLSDCDRYGSVDLGRQRGVHAVRGAHLLRHPEVHADRRSQPGKRIGLDDKQHLPGNRDPELLVGRGVHA